MKKSNIKDKTPESSNFSNKQKPQKQSTIILFFFFFVWCFVCFCCCPFGWRCAAFRSFWVVVPFSSPPPEWCCFPSSSFWGGAAFSLLRFGGCAFRPFPFHGWCCSSRFLLWGGARMTSVLTFSKVPRQGEGIDKREDLFLTCEKVRRGTRIKIQMVSEHLILLALPHPLRERYC